MADVITLAALRALVSYADPRVSPDGSQIAYVRTARDYVRDRNASMLVVVGADGSRRRIVDAGPFVGSPRWSPDGTRLAYLRHTPKHEEDQITVVPEHGGGTTTITRVRNGVQHFAWSPDGTRFAFDTPDNEPNAARAKRHDDVFELGDDGFLTDKPLVPSHLWLVPSTGGRAKRLTHGVWSVYEQVAPFTGGASDPSWSPDGRTIVFARAPDAHDAATDRSSVAAVDVATGAVRDLGTLRQYVYAPAFGPNGTSYAYTHPHGPGPISATDIFVAPRGGGDGTDITVNLDRDVQSIRWSGNTIVATATDHLQQAIYVVSPAGSAYRAGIGELSVADVGVGPHGMLAFVAGTFSKPPEIYVMDHRGAAPRAITHDNAALRRLAYPRVERLSWSAPDGQVSEGILVHPLGEVPGRAYPLMVWHHGGPEWASNLSYDEGTDEGWPVGALAGARGWFVLMPNYRGSDDLGTAHEHAIYQDPGAGPMSDTMAGIAAVEGRVKIDTSRECVGGHSYGGDMTAWIIGHTTRFRCAVIADGAVDWIEAYDLSGTGNRAWTRDSLGATPWNAAGAQRYHDASPITYAAQVRTPTLLITGLADQVVPFVESWAFYHALRDNHVPVRLVGIPTAHHSPTDPVRAEAYQRTILDYLSEHLR